MAQSCAKPSSLFEKARPNFLTGQGQGAGSAAKLAEQREASDSGPRRERSAARIQILRAKVPRRRLVFSGQPLRRDRIPAALCWHASQISQLFSDAVPPFSLCHLLSPQWRRG